MFKQNGKCHCDEFFLSGTHPIITRNGFLHTERHCKRNVLGSRNDPISLENAVRNLVEFGKRFQQHREAVEEMERNRI